MATAFLYNDGSFVFSSGDVAASNKTLVTSYTGWDTAEYTSSSQVPWYSDGNYTSIISVLFDGTVSPISTAYWFYKCSNLTSLDFTNLDTSNVTNMESMFNGCNMLTSLDLSSFDTSNVTSMTSMFYKCTDLVSLNVSSFNTSNVTKMYYMFRDCSSIISLNLSNFNTSNVTNMGNMFSGCKYITSLDISNFDTSNVTNMGSMFSNCTSLTSLDLSHFNTSKVTIMGYMFSSCTSLTVLNISSFDTSKVTTMDYMFEACLALTTIEAPIIWSTESVTSSSSMFTGCSSLVGGNGTTYNSSYSDATYARIDTPETPGYFTKYYPLEIRGNFVIRGETLYDITDKIRVLNGSEDDMTPAEMQTTLETHNTEMTEVLTTQDDLIVQIATALEGKTGASGGGIEFSHVGFLSDSVSASSYTYSSVPVSSYYAIMCISGEDEYCMVKVVDNVVSKTIKEASTFNITSEEGFVNFNNTATYAQDFVFGYFY